MKLPEWTSENADESHAPSTESLAVGAIVASLKRLHITVDVF